MRDVSGGGTNTGAKNLCKQLLDQLLIALTPRIALTRARTKNGMHGAVEVEVSDRVGVQVYETKGVRGGEGHRLSKMTFGSACP